jgi:alcohol dehydrogenase (NADP+)
MTASIPRLGFGTFNNFEGDPSVQDDPSLSKAVEVALAAGYRHIDCAEFYHNEKAVGAALHSSGVPRAELFLVSKAWNNHRTEQSLRASVVATCQALRTDYLDLYLIHWPCCWSAELMREADGSLVIGEPDSRGEAVALAEAWRGMEALVDAGLVRQIGVSNYGVGRLRRLLETCRIRPACNQVECHPHFAQTELLEYCKAEGVAFVAYHPIGKPNHRKEGQPVAIREQSILKISERLGTSPACVILAWQLRRGAVAIPKSCTPSRIVENFGAPQIEEKLTADDLAAIAALDAGTRFCKPTFMTSWD